MDITNLKLNDFEAMDKILQAQPCNLYDPSLETFGLPIDHPPETIEEHQLCHYAMWMTIWKYKLCFKPILFVYVNKDNVWSYTNVRNSCFACEYGKTKHCPIKVWRPCCCDTPNDVPIANAYYYWGISGDPSKAYDIAHLEWADD